MHSLWLPSIALNVPLVLKPGSQEPWTPARICQALIAAGAVCTVAGPSGERQVAVEDVVVGPGKTSLGADEFVVDFRLPARPPRSGDASARSRRRIPTPP